MVKAVGAGAVAPTIAATSGTAYRIDGGGGAKMLGLAAAGT